MLRNLLVSVLGLQDEQESVLIERQREWKQTYKELENSIGIDNATGFVSERFPEHIPEPVERYAEDFRQYEDSGLIDTASIGGEEFIHTTERGDYISSNEDLLTEVNNAEEIVSFGTTAMELLSDADSCIPESYNGKTKSHESGIVEKQILTQSGEAKWRMTPKGGEIKDLTFQKPLHIRQALEAETIWQPTALDTAKTVNQFHYLLDEAAASGDIAEATRQLDGRALETQIEFLDVYTDILTAGALPRLTSQNISGVPSLLYEVDGLKQIYRALEGEADASVLVSIEYDMEEARGDLFSDIQETYQRIRRAHRDTYCSR